MTQKITIEQTNFADGWIPVSDSWAYASADAPTFTITVPSGAASLYSPGMRIKLTQTTVKYFIITAVTDTVLTVYGGTDYTLVDAAISAISYSTQKAPFGFPLSPAKWSVVIIDSTDRTQVATDATVYNIGSIAISVPIGSWKLSAKIANGTYSNDNHNNVGMKSYLSTQNNAVSDAQFGCVSGNQYTGITPTANRIYQTGIIEGLVEISSKTIYYLVHVRIHIQSVTLRLRSESDHSTVLSAVCSYL